MIGESKNSFKSKFAISEGRSRPVLNFSFPFMVAGTHAISLDCLFMFHTQFISENVLFESSSNI